MFEEELEIARVQEVKKSASLKAAQMVTDPLSPFRGPSGSFNQLKYPTVSGSKGALDSRLVSNPNKTTAVDQSSKRRLAPTQVTTESIFPAGGPPVPLWRQGEEVIVPKTPSKSQTTLLSGGTPEFQRTPRAPRIVSDFNKKMETAVAEHESGMCVSLGVYTL